jgi:hypothetical protein
MNSEVVHAILVAAIFAAGFLGIGGGVLRAAGVLRGEGDALRLSPIAIAIGFATCSYMAYPLVALAPPHPAVVLLVMLAGIAGGYRYWGAFFTDLRTSVEDVIRTRTASTAPLVFLALSAGFLLLVSTHWFTPTSEGDALSGYMFNARWLYMHGLTYSPYNTVYNLYPFNTELVFSLSFAFGNDLIPKVLDGILGLFLLGGIYEFARRYADRRSSFFAAASMATMNAFASTWATGKVDILTTLTLFCGVSLLFLTPGQWPTRVLALSAFLVGTACAQKYTAWVFAAAFVIGLTVVMRGEPFGRIFRCAVFTSAIIIGCLLPHFAKTLAWTGNPVAPFGRSLFPSKGVYLNPHDFSDATPTSLAEMPMLPYKLFLDFDLRHWPGPFPLLILVGVPLVWVSRGSVHLRRLAAFTAVQLIVWVAVRGDEWFHPRYLLTPTALLLVVAAGGVDSGSSRKPAFGLALTVVMALSLAYLGIWQNRDWRRSWSFVLGREDRAAWHEHIVPARAFGALQAVAPLLGPDRRLFITASHYYIPDDKLPYISTERDVAEFWSLPPGKQLDFLSERCFGFFHVFGKVKNNPAWTRGFPVVSQWKDSADGLEYTLFRLDTQCGPSDTPASHDSSGTWGSGPHASVAANPGCSVPGAQLSVEVLRSARCP